MNFLKPKKETIDEVKEYLEKRYILITSYGNPQTHNELDSEINTNLRYYIFND